MQKLKRSKFVVVAIVIFSMVAMYGYMPTVNAANMETASITLGDSSPDATATSTISFNLVTTLPAGGYIRADFTASDFTGFAVAGIDCGLGGSTGASTTDEIVDCTYAAGRDTATHTIDVLLTNSSTTGIKNVTVTAYTSLGVEIESTAVAAFVIDSVTVTANVAATLSFAISGTSTGALINNVATTEDSSTTTIPFGTLTDGNQKVVGQDLSVTTNASGGFTVTVEQSQPLTSGAGAIIDSFIDGTPSTGAGWTGPTPVLGSEETYGHMGVTSNDAGLASGNFVGLTTGVPQLVMYNGGVADGTTAGVGYASVAYSVEISALQEAGDYESSITYVCTPTY